MIILQNNKKNLDTANYHCKISINYWILIKLFYLCLAIQVQVTNVSEILSLFGYRAWIILCGHKDIYYRVEFSAQPTKTFRK